MWVDVTRSHHGMMPCSVHQPLQCQLSTAASFTPRQHAILHVYNQPLAERVPHVDVQLSFDTQARHMYSSQAYMPAAPTHTCHETQNYLGSLLLHTMPVVVLRTSHTSTVSCTCDPHNMHGKATSRAPQQLLPPQLAPPGQNRVHFAHSTLKQQLLIKKLQQGRRYQY